MKQVIEDCRTGAIAVPEVASPACRAGTVLVRNRASLISAGTEAAMLQFGQQNLLQKARSRPDLVRQVMGKVRADGLWTTYQAVQSRLELPLALGYACAGDVIETGPNVDLLPPGTRVACAGAGYASHAEIVAVPKNLVVPIPENVSYDAAAFSTTGAIALQGLRVADVRIGEKVVVIGLGLIGLLTVQLLKAAGCLVLGADPNPVRTELARQLGADAAYPVDSDTLIPAVAAFTAERGADVVLITAATKSNEPIEIAGEISRLKGRVVAVGDVGLDVPRRTYYEKELDLRLSRSYGPGRYDPSYEEKGQDYPYAYVPFTEQRNLETFLRMVAAGRVTPERLITHRFTVAESAPAYRLIQGETHEPHLGVLFTYPQAATPVRRVAHVTAHNPDADARGDGKPTDGKVGIGVIGAGAYARHVLLPRLHRRADVHLVGVSNTRGVTAWSAADRFGFQFSATDPAEVLGDPAVDLVLIATRHDSHAQLAGQALAAGKHVFLEKPMATDEADLRRLVQNAESAASRHLMVGFNRRFAPLIQRAKTALAQRSQPLTMLYRINAGQVPSDHWTQDAREGGGRIVGEVCHFVDLLQHLCDSPPISVFAAATAGASSGVGAEAARNTDVVSIVLRFADGSIGTIQYVASGDRAIPKEYLEVHGDGATLILEDFRRARFARNGRIATWKGRGGQDKGQSAALQALLGAITRNDPPPIPLTQSVTTTLTTLRILDSLRLGREMPVGWSESQNAVTG